MKNCISQLSAGPPWPRRGPPRTRDCEPRGPWTEKKGRRREKERDLGKEASAICWLVLRDSMTPAETARTPTQRQPQWHRNHRHGDRGSWVRGACRSVTQQTNRKLPSEFRLLRGHHTTRIVKVTRARSRCGPRGRDPGLSAAAGSESEAYRTVRLVDLPLAASVRVTARVATPGCPRQARSPGPRLTVRLVAVGLATGSLSPSHGPGVGK